MAISFESSGKLCEHHLVFHVLLLYRQFLGGDRVEPSAPVTVMDVDEYNVEALIIHRYQRV